MFNNVFLFKWVVLCFQFHIFDSLENLILMLNEMNCGTWSCRWKEEWFSFIHYSLSWHKLKPEFWIIPFLTRVWTCHPIFWPCKPIHCVDETALDAEDCARVSSASLICSADLRRAGRIFPKALLPSYRAEIPSNPHSQRSPPGRLNAETRDSSRGGELTPLLHKSLFSSISGNVDN